MSFASSGKPGSPTDPATEYRPATWRLILHGAQDGATNMAIDEAILSAVIEGSSPPTLRFYAWSPPCLSLGRNQPLAEVDLAACRAHGVDVVRRPTGGRAILHTDELTYSVTLLQSDPRATGDVVDSYRRLSEGLMAGLLSLGVGAAQVTGQHNAGLPPTPVCFEMPSKYEIAVGGRKLVGSAQWRARGGVLQHGSLPLHGDLARIVDYLQFDDDRRPAQRHLVRARALTLAEALGRVLTFDEAAQAMTEGFARALRLNLVQGHLTEREQSHAAELRRERYGAESWTADS